MPPSLVNPFEPSFLLHDWKGKRSGSSFEFDLIGNSCASYSSFMIPTPHWPSMDSLPPFNPPAGLPFNIGSGGLSQSENVDSNIFGSTSCTSVTQSHVSHTVSTSSGLFLTLLLK
ncbi:hypothetical protein MKX03_029924 [Papaver bracteatum]|nr:hypothetical protein MKX03_029924 [Papaver bracteatum]